ncbi:MAG: acyltransferase family protein [Bacillota bacterium]|nr:acyltransferase family protein [Bacillota bacterium]
MDTVIGSDVGRVKWVDILKGLGILTVVWGHSGSPNSFYMFWFHMPLFFLVSGYLYNFKPHQTWGAYVGRKVKHLIIPYSFYLVLLTLFMGSLIIWRGQPVGQFLSENWESLVLGGSLLEGVYATFWFTTCLFFTQISYDYLCRKVPSAIYKGLLVTGCFFLAYWESRYRAGAFVPWNADVGLYALVFYALGQAIRQTKLLEKPESRNKVFGLALLLLLGFLYLYTHKILDYGLDMKHRQYYYLGTNLVVPLVFTLLLAGLSMSLSKSKVPYLNKALIHLGKAAMVIMYLHLASVDLARRFIAITPPRFFVLGLLGPLAFYSLVQRFSYGRLLALGETKKEMRTQFSGVKGINSRAV